MATITSGNPVKEKKVTILMGLTGAGKTSAGLERGSMVLESDDIKAMLPEYDGGKGATSLMKESNMMNDKLLERAIKEGYAFTLPGVGTNKAWTKQLIQELHDAGWSTQLTFVDIPPTESMNRVVSRFNKEGRYVDPAFLVTHGRVPAQNFHDLVDELYVNGDALNGYKHVWNFKQPIVLEETHRTAYNISLIWVITETTLRFCQMAKSPFCSKTNIKAALSLWPSSPGAVKQTPTRARIYGTCSCRRRATAAAGC